MRKDRCGCGYHIYHTPTLHPQYIEMKSLIICLSIRLAEEMKELYQHHEGTYYYDGN
jgi:hypothetical protein